MDGRKLDEILFEHRNKKYGAYFLRKINVSVLNKSIIIMALVFSLAWLSILFFYAGEEISFFRKPVVFDVSGQDKMDFILPPPPLTNTEKTDLSDEIKHQPNIDLKIIPVSTIAGKAENNTVAVNRDESGITDNKLIRKIDENKTDTAEKNQLSEIPDRKYKMVVLDSLPSFPGGDIARVNFIRFNILYPKEDRERGVAGTVVVAFVVEKDGRITGVNVLKGLTPSTNKEALRIVGKMPRWFPGYSEGKPVRVAVDLPVRFVLL